MLSLLDKAASLVKSGVEVMPHQFFTPALVQADQLAPPSKEKYMFPLLDKAASLEKSGLEAIPSQLPVPAPVTTVHVTPLSLDM
jgi:hypothetical protein